MNKNLFKSAGAIFAGMIAGALLSIGTDLVFEKLNIFPPEGEGLFVWWMLLIALFYRGIYTVTSGYIAATLAPSKPMRHAVILGIIGFVVTLAGSIANWDKSAAWYPVVLILITLPCTWAGGWLVINQKKEYTEESIS